ncbi:Mediator of RNA polymerase II transcription subunit 14 [Cyberlindnera fabianii]|uniref:Mediator of RNA polymerase II transcription subunit 14 n=1 Tax=Cyberlindnera fabianii TaxID=36022 RepID=A0A1V2L957_CYBFA|nr:Mediator of RNA polymerase II transcription subunit 14 [Cyberlindnera fabianii]
MDTATMKDQQSQVHPSQGPPEIPHITTNIIPLSQILRKFAESSFSELQQVIQTQPNNEAKKKRLLELIVRLRQEYVRLYVLTKWSRTSAQDFTKFIDILVWLKEQTFHFNNLIWGTKSLNQSLLSAKLPNPDLITALEVYTNGRPTLPTHNFIEPKISTKKVLSTLKELNTILYMKYATADDLPEEFTNYSIKDGRIYIYTEDYNLQISTADETGPFFLISFEFTFGDFVTSRHLMRVCNETLRTSGFQELKRLLTNYTNTMKLYLIHQKLSPMKTIKHVYHQDKFQIVVHYWVNSFVFKYSYIEIGLNRANKIVYKWFRQGEYIETFDEVQDFGLFLRDIYHRHATFILDQIDDLTVNKSLLQINELTGLFYFKNTTPTLNASLKKLNIDDFKNINDNLQSIRMDVKFLKISTILSVTGWIPNELIKLNPQELKKLPSPIFQQEKAYALTKNMKFYTRKEWPSNWFLILFIDTKVKSFIGNIKSMLGQWTLQAPSELNIESFDYKISKQLIDYVSKKIMIHLITQELHGSTYKVSKDDTIVVKTDTFIKIPNTSNVLYMTFKVEPDNKTMLVKVKGKLNTELTLEDFAIDPSGVFEIFEVIHFRRTSILGNIVSKLERLAKIIELINYLKLEKMNLVSVKLDQVVFKYGDQVCVLKDNFDLELPANNPHNLCLVSIKGYLATKGVGHLFKYLQDSRELVTKLNEISASAQTENLSTFKTDKLRYEVVTKSSSMFSIVYYMGNSKSREILQMNIQIKANGGTYHYFIGFESLQYAEYLKQDLTLKGPLYSSMKSTTKITPLVNGVMVDEAGLGQVIDYFHNRIKENSTPVTS